MIFISLGSQKFQFNRLLEAVDSLIELGKITEEVFAQVGYSDYQPKHYKSSQFLDRDKFSEVMSKARLLITHGGTGAIIGGVKSGKKVIAISRLERFGEHVDDHQLQIVQQFEDMNLICACYDMDDLAKSMIEVDESEYTSYVSNSKAIIDDIRNYINHS